MRGWARSQAIFAALALAACASVDPPETEPPPTPPDPLAELTEACRALTEIQCAQIEACDPLKDQAFIGSHATCVDANTAFCVDQALAEGSGITKDNLAACAVASAHASCADLAAFQSWVEVPSLAACDPSGSLENGRPCFAPSQCRSGHCANGIVGLLGCGVCADPVPDGQACAFFFDCERGRHCTLGVCTIPGALGDPCGECQWDLACRDGVCSPWAVTGYPCASDADCAGNQGYWCDLPAGECAPLALAADGQACGFSLSPPTICAAPDDCKAGKCVPLPTEGEPCETGTLLGLPCRYPYECHGGTCATTEPSMCRPPETPP